MAGLKLAEYLFTRLRQLGVDAMHGVPGDFNLSLLDYVEPAGLRWVGNANELNAGYAADGYARIKGVGALITTFGVGELSALNAIAGAYAERAAVIHIVGTPPRATQDARLTVHHTFNDGEFRRFAQMSKPVTVAQTELRDPRTSPEQIDTVLQLCLLHSRPVYIEVPVDMVGALVSSERLSTPIRIPDNISHPAQDAVLAKILDRVHSAKQPIILVDGETRPLGILDQVSQLIKTLGWPTWVTGFGKGLIDETLPNVHGIYRGKFESPKKMEFFTNSDLVLCFGPHFSSTNTYSRSAIPKVENTIAVKDTEIVMGGEVLRDLPARWIASQLLQKLTDSRPKVYDPYPDLSSDSTLPLADLTPSQPITQDRFWHVLANHFRPGDIVLGETGSASYGTREMPLPQHAKMFVANTWLSIGYMLPAAQGAALAQRELVSTGKYDGISDARTILSIGDGSFQMTAQELGTIIRLDLDVILILINNDGYTIERCIHGLDQSYNDIPRWRYQQAPSLFGAREGTYVASARTWGELKEALASEQMNRGKGLRMLEVIVDREDFPPGQLLNMLNEQKTKKQEQLSHRGMNGNASNQK